MENAEFIELSGRIEGIARAFMLLAVEVEESKVIPSGFCERLSSMSASLQFENQAVLDATRTTLGEISSGIELAHKRRPK